MVAVPFAPLACGQHPRLSVLFVALPTLADLLTLNAAQWVSDCHGWRTAPSTGSSPGRSTQVADTRARLLAVRHESWPRPPNWTRWEKRKRAATMSDIFKSASTLVIYAWCS
jgi:hypothetical protein